MLDDHPRQDNFTGYHFHNFFSDLNVTRFKYFSFGEPDMDALDKKLSDLHDGLGVGFRCVKNIPDDPGAKMKWKPGGFEALEPPLPLYFLDRDYRRRRFNHIREKVEADDKAISLRRTKLNVSGS